MSDSTTGRVLITGIPDGLAAEPVRGADGTLPRDRRGRVKTTEVTLTTAGVGDVAPTAPVCGVDDADVRWAISATRRWSGIISRFGERATAVANTLCGPESSRSAPRSPTTCASAPTGPGRRRSNGL